MRSRLLIREREAATESLVDRRNRLEDDLKQLRNAVEEIKRRNEALVHRYLSRDLISLLENESQITLSRISDAEKELAYVSARLR